MEEEGEKKRFRLPGLIRNDFWRKLVALLLAALLYAAVGVRLTENETLEVPVEVILPRNLMNRDNVSLRTKLRLRASRSVLAEIDPAAVRVTAEVDENNYIAGEPYRLRLRPSSVGNLPF